MSRSKIISRSGWLISIASAGYFITFAKQNYEQSFAINIDISSFLFLLLFSIVHVIGLYFASIAWAILLRQYGYTSSQKSTTSIYFKAQFAKYLPGNIGHHVGRVILAKQIGIPTHVTVQTIFTEIIALIWLGSILSLLYFSSVNPDLITTFHHNVKPQNLFLLVLICTLLPPVSIKFFNKYLPQLVFRITGSTKVPIPSAIAIAKIVFLQLLTFASAGIIINLVAIHLLSAADTKIWHFICVYAFSWLAGTIVPGAPAGIGVREAIMVSTLSPIYGASIAISISVLLRIITSMGDVIGFLIGILLNSSHADTRKA